MFEETLSNLTVYTFDILRKKGPSILTGLASVGVVSTAVLAVKGSRKVDQELPEEDISTKETLKIVAKSYAPAFISGAITIGCCIGSNEWNKQKQRSLTAAYILLRERYDAYIQKVKEHFGEEAHEEIEHELLIERAEAPFISCQGFIKGSTTSVDLTDETRRLFYDAYSGKLFESTMAKVLEAEYHLNRNMALGAFVTMKDWYDFLGIKCFDDCPPWKVNPECLDALGWEVNDSYQWIDFDHDVAKMEFPNGSGMTELEAVVIHFEFDPMPESYYDY